MFHIYVFIYVGSQVLEHGFSTKWLVIEDLSHRIVARTQARARIGSPKYRFSVNRIQLIVISSRLHELNASDIAIYYLPFEKFT